MGEYLTKFQIFLENIDSFRDKAFNLWLKKIWPKSVTPNAVTWVRVFIGIALLMLIFFFDITDKALIITLFCIGLVTDLVDGPLARCTNQITEFGAMLDSTADRMLILPVAFYILYHYHKWLLLVLVLVEIINALFSIYYKSKEIYLESNIFGKTKMVLLSVFFVAALFVWPSLPHPAWAYLLWLSIIFSFLSIFSKTIEYNKKNEADKNI